MRRTAEVLIAEIGVDMNALPTSKDLASWASVCPGNDESAGKRRSGTTRRAKKWPVSRHSTGPGSSLRRQRHRASAIVAEGADSEAVMTWIVAHGGNPRPPWRHRRAAACTARHSRLGQPSAPCSRSAWLD